MTTTSHALARRLAPRAALAALAAALLACGGSGSDVQGRWTGADAAGNRMTFDFRGGGEGSWIVEVGQAPPETIAMRYETDPSATPATIDLNGFGSGPLEGRVMAGIYELTGDGALRLDFEPVADPSEADSARPTEFTDDAVEFERVEDG